MPYILGGIQFYKLFLMADEHSSLVRSKNLKTILEYLSKQWKHSFLKELFPTFLGVFLAFYLNDIWVHRQEVQLARQVQQALEIELRQNLGQIKEQLPYHQVMYDSAVIVSNMYHEKGGKGIKSTYFWRGIGASQISDAAYLTSISTQNLAKMNLPLLISIADAYSAQRDYESILESARVALLGKEWPNYLVWLNYMRWTASNLIEAEKKVIQTHEKALALIQGP